jgi:hypothetical protein
MRQVSDYVLQRMSTSAVCNGTVVERVCIVWIDFNGLCKVQQCLSIVAEPAASNATVAVGNAVRCVDGNDLRVVSDCFVQHAHVGVHHCAAVQSSVVRSIERNGMCQVSQCFAVLVQRHKRRGSVGEGLCNRAIESNGMGKVGHCLDVLTESRVHQTSIVVRTMVRLERDAARQIIESLCVVAEHSVSQGSVVQRVRAVALTEQQSAIKVVDCALEAALVAQRQTAVVQDDRVVAIDRQCTIKFVYSFLVLACTTVGQALIRKCVAMPWIGHALVAEGRKECGGVMWHAHTNKEARIAPSRIRSNLYKSTCSEVVKRAGLKSLQQYSYA